MNFNDTFNLISKSANENYASLRKLADINMNAWDQMASKQMEVMNLCFETSCKQAELGKDVKRVDELFGKQTEMARELSEQLLESNQQVAEILSKTREEYQGWIEAGAAQARSQVEQITTVNTRKAA